MKAIVVDDERSIRETLTEILKMEGFEVKSFGDIEQTLSILPASDINLMIVGNRLPDGNGLDLLEQVKFESPGVSN